LITST